ncbi:hypothetical protein [Anaeromyxobacter oryzae]|uniref:Uncharacterized protein n=1 Tax=Anaeromyxobacter oryzae TaxID=2918170 RepID=A0ABN6MSN5_9BACT|nr:hypothetical protein [Anaeromyxobacter oryzae]BDG03998.1 hypothetical protein AMOR_29940 [Anaeromyxobacter oryzae]
MLAPALALLLAAAGPASPAPHAPAGPAATPPGAKAAPSPPADALERRRAAIADEMVRLGARLQRDIESGDVAAILARVPPDGLSCGGRIVPRARIEHDLRNPASWLHGVLLGGPGAPAAAGGRPASLRAFFAGAKEVAVLVAFRRDPRAAPVGRPCLDFRARDLATPGVPFCFEQRGGKWWLTESLYPCD